MEDMANNLSMLHDAQGVERCRQCAEAVHQLLTTERQVIERRILVLTYELGFLESHINVLEMQQCRLRPCPLPEPVQRMQLKILTTLKAQHRLIKQTVQNYMRTQIEMVSGGVLAAGHWQYSQNINEHNDIMRMLQ